MCCIVTRISHYLEYCKKQKKLSPNTLRAYHIDMTQFISYLRVNKLEAIDEEGITKEILRDYVNHLLATYAPRTSKRKIACLKAFSVCQRSHFAAVRSGFFDKLTRPAGLFALLAVFICGVV